MSLTAMTGRPVTLARIVRMFDFSHQCFFDCAAKKVREPI